jgi:hypothetical protein
MNTGNVGAHLTKDLLKLMEERDNFLCQPKTLLADMVLQAYVINVLESVQAATGILILRPNRIPHRAFSLVRLSFEAAQQGMVLATQDDYAYMGAKAFVYYIRRDKKWLLQAKPYGSGINNEDDAKIWFEDKLKDIANTWDSFSAGQGKLVEQARVELQKQGSRPDNWLGKDMALAQDEAYRKIASHLKIDFDQLSMINRAHYSSLSRDSHAGLIINTDVTFENLPNGIKATTSPRDNDTNSKIVIETASESVFEIQMALNYRKHYHIQ